MICFFGGDLELLLDPWSTIKPDKLPLKQWAWGREYGSTTHLQYLLSPENCLIARWISEFTFFRSKFMKF